MPEARIKSKLPIEIVVENDARHHTSERKPWTRAYRRASIPSTNVGAGCSCHPTGAQHHLSPRVPLHPVWQTPVARLSVLTRLVPIWITTGLPTDCPESSMRPNLGIMQGVLFRGVSLQ